MGIYGEQGYMGGYRVQGFLSTRAWDSNVAVCSGMIRQTSKDAFWLILDATLQYHT